MKSLNLISSLQATTNMSILKFYAFCGALVTLLAFAWINFYVIPHDEVRMLIMQCQADMHDFSYESYEYCHNTLNPNNR